MEIQIEDFRGGETMSGQVKKIDSSKFQEMLTLTRYAFHKDPTGGEKAVKFLFKHSEKYGFFQEDGALTSDVICSPFTVNFHGAEYLADGIGYVASYPETRGNGSINHIMQEILDDEYEKGTVLSYLAPFSYEFYRRYGYEQVFNQAKIAWKAVDFPQGKRTNGGIKRYPYEQALPLLKEVYEKYPPFQRGSLKRSDWWWEYWFKIKIQDYYFTVFEDEEGVPQGYVIYQFEGMNFAIHEWVSLTGEALQATTRFISSHAGAFDTVTYLSPESDVSSLSILHQMKEPRFSLEIIPSMQVRIVSIEKFLKVYPFESKKPLAFTLDIQDATASWNEGLWEVELGDKTIVRKVEQTNSQTISGTIQSLTQWFFGYRKLVDLTFEDKLSLSKNASMNELNEITVKELPVLADYF